jgi:hypothetical protein
MELTNKEKAEVLNSRLRSLYFNKYNHEVDLLTENAKSTPSAVSITNINTFLAEVNRQITALQTELEKYPVEEE